MRDLRGTDVTLRIADDLSLPLDWMSLSTVVYGARGAGKTTLGSVVAEEVFRQHQRFCAIDLKGDWWGLKSSTDGKEPGIPVVIFGGDHADLPLEPDAGAYIAETIAALEQPTILDLENLSKGKQLRFLGAFFERLYDRNREPLLLILDEAQRYAPQRPMNPEATVCLGAVEDLVKLGRKHGIGPMLLTQRGSGLNKEVSELCDMLVAFRTPGPLDQDRVKDWLDANATREQRDQVMSQLAKLDTGTAIFASGHPALRVFQVAAVRPRDTFDSSATPKIGQRRREPKILAQGDLEALKDRMSEAIERAKAEDPKELRKEIARLRAELAAKPKIETETVERIVREPFIPDEVRTLAGEATKIGEALVSALHDLTGSLTTDPPKKADVIPIRPPTSEARLERDLQRSIERENGKHFKPSAPDAKPGFQPDGSFVYELSRGEKAFLNILAQYPQGRSKSQLAVLAGYSPKSGGNDQILANLRKMGAIDGKASLLTITEDGRGFLGKDFEPLPTGAELREYWMTNALLSTGAKTFLRLLIEAYPESLSKAELAESAGYSPKSGGNDQILADLRRRDLITGTAAALRVSDDLFSV